MRLEKTWTWWFKRGCIDLHIDAGAWSFGITFTLLHYRSFWLFLGPVCGGWRARW